ncbi:MAG: hypothetical protein LBD67_01270 [Candidatus Accumulibacter sp.]|jgi:hypothetical protein|nr:hypothetical protein [Accumulibacter sp.]
MNAAIPFRPSGPKVFSAAFLARLAAANRVYRALTANGCPVRRVDFGETEITIVAGRNPHWRPAAHEGIRLIWQERNSNHEKGRAAGNAADAGFLEQKLEEWAGALLKLRASFAQMVAVKNRAANQNDRQALARVIGQRAGELGGPYQTDFIDMP